jgi:hypothetical protein
LHFFWFHEPRRPTCLFHQCQELRFCYDGAAGGGVAAAAGIQEIPASEVGQHERRGLRLLRDADLTEQNGAIPTLQPPFQILKDALAIADVVISALQT